MEKQQLNSSSLLTRIAEIFENERYQLTTMTWTSKGLLISDRNIYSTRDGRIGWTTLEQAEEALSSKGWCWGENSWSIDYNNSDSEGWIYGSNFETIETNGSSIKGISHFVRRRRRIRKQIFVVGAVDGTCDHCDSSQITFLSNKLLEALCQTSLHEYPGSESPPDPNINRLKDLLMDMIGLGSISTSPPHTQISLKDVVHKLDRFLTYVLEHKSLWSKAASIFTPECSPDDYPIRSEELNLGVFTSIERDIIACALIRKYDNEFIYHCNKKNCGEGCIYSIHTCTHSGCNVRYSLKYQMEHEEICPFKLIPCSRDCGEAVIRQEMKAHLEEFCPKRPVTCPYHLVGCPVKELFHRDLTSHLETSLQNHLLVLTQHTIEQNQTIQKMQRKITELEDHLTHQSSLVSSLQATCSGTIIHVRNIEKIVDEREIKGSDSKNTQSKKYDESIEELKNEIIKLKVLYRGLERDTVNKLTGLT